MASNVWAQLGMPDLDRANMMTAQAKMMSMPGDTPIPPPMVPTQVSAKHMEALKQYLPKAGASGSSNTDAYTDQADRALDDQKGTLKGLNDYIDQMAAKPQGTNLSPLASYVDTLTGSNLAPVAEKMAPMNPDDKDKMLFGLRNQLAQGQAKFSADQLKALSEQKQMQQYLRHQQELERHNVAMEGKTAAGATAQQARAQTMMGNQAFQQVSKIHDDSAIKQMRMQAANVDKGLELMAVPNVSNKSLSEVAQDISAALTGKAAASDFKLRELMTPSLKEELSNKLAYLTANPEQPAPPDVVKFWRNMGARLQESYDTQLEARAQGKLAGMEIASKYNPMAFEAATEAANLYKKGGWRKLEGRPMPGIMIPPPHGPVVKQNGKTYNWDGKDYVEAN